MAMPADSSILAAVQAADEAGIKIEMVGGLPVWESMPTARHQRAVYAIQRSIAPRNTQEGGCGCVSYADVLVRFEDGSFKRPDIAIFCREPDEQDEAITLLPEAVIEIVSAGYEAKDYDIGLPFYLKIGVKDVVIFDPIRNHVLHARRDGTGEFVSPVKVQFECGCLCIV